MEQSTEAHSSGSHSSSAATQTVLPTAISAQHVQQRTAEQVIDVLDDAGTGAQQRTVGQVVDAPTETGTAETVPAETEPATHPLDGVPLGVTHRVERPEVRAKRAPRPPLLEVSLSRSVRLELERVRYEQAAQRRFKRARARSAERKAL